MTLTPAKLDAIATKLLGWTKAYAGDVQNVYHPMPGIKTVTRTLYTHDPADAMLVLEAMGKWCGSKRCVTCEGDSGGWTCAIYEWESPADSGPHVMANGDTIPAAVFACAAQLVERM